MSAMPEREVFATELNEQEWLVSYLREAMKMAEKLVPESRLLAAEARVREVEAEREKFREQVSKLVDDINGFYPRNQAILEESRALRADREALAHHLLRYGWHAADCPFLQDTLPCTCGLGAAETHARAILARAVGA